MIFGGYNGGPVAPLDKGRGLLGRGGGCIPLPPQGLGITTDQEMVPDQNLMLLGQRARGGFWRVAQMNRQQKAITKAASSVAQAIRSQVVKSAQRGCPPGKIPKKIGFVRMCVPDKAGLARIHKAKVKVAKAAQKAALTPPPGSGVVATRFPGQACPAGTKAIPVQGGRKINCYR